MIEIKRGKIVKELFARPGIKGFLVLIDGKEEKCISYPAIVGEIVIGNEVLVNTTAVSLALGSGGYHYIISNIESEGKELSPGGHIMKLRYTPLQLKVLSVEEEDSPYHQQMKAADSLNNTPVLAATLHSMLAPLCLQLASEGLKAAYVMTDGAALPIYFSRTVEWLKKNNLLSGTVTVGHAFGGDLEAVNVYSGLLAAKEVFKPDVIIVSMGPGIVGTGTKWGYTGVEQGEILNAVDTLNGIPIGVPRISFADPRERHKGISHHTLTVLSRICRVRSIIPLPLLAEPEMAYILEQLRQEKLLGRYNICAEESSSIIDLIKASELKITTMGRGVDEEKEFFLTLGAAAITAKRLVKGEPLREICLA